MRCEHERVQIREYLTAFTDHNRSEDGGWSHHTDTGYYTGKLWVICDCGLNKEYGRKNRPKWLAKRLDEMDI